MSNRISCFSQKPIRQQSQRPRLQHHSQPRFFLLTWLCSQWFLQQTPSSSVAPKIFEPFFRNETWLEHCCNQAMAVSRLQSSTNWDFNVFSGSARTKSSFTSFRGLRSAFISLPALSNVQNDSKIPWIGTKSAVTTGLRAMYPRDVLDSLVIETQQRGLQWKLRFLQTSTAMTWVNYVGTTVLRLSCPASFNEKS